MVASMGAVFLERREGSKEATMIVIDLCVDFAADGFEKMNDGVVLFGMCTMRNKWSLV